MCKTLVLPGGLCPGRTGGLKRPPDPSPNNFAPPISNSWLWPCKNPRHPIKLRLVNYMKITGAKPALGPNSCLNKIIIFNILSILHINITFPAK